MKTIQELQDILDDDFLDPNMPKQLVEEEMRALGLNPDEVTQRGVAFIGRCLANKDQAGRVSG